MGAARRAGISSAYLSKLENDSVRRPSPAILYRLGEVLGVPYVELMALAGHPLPMPAAEILAFSPSWCMPHTAPRRTRGKAVGPLVDLSPSRI
jgi:transcriptional regulator with XRE-family HTH domain